MLDNLPDVSKITEIREPWIKGEIVVPQQFIGLVDSTYCYKAWLQSNLSYIDERALISFEAPLEPFDGFYDQLKSITSGYGSFNYELDTYRPKILFGLIFMSRVKWLTP